MDVSASRASPPLLISIRILLSITATVVLCHAIPRQRDYLPLLSASSSSSSSSSGVPAKGLDNKSGFVRFGLGQNRRPLPPPSEGWLVIMQRFDFSVDFNRNWREYRNGFGELDLQKEFWLGNEAIHLLTSRFAHKLRIEMIANAALFHADYESFAIDSEDKKYALQISGYSGNAGDSLTNNTVTGGWNHNGASFSTLDRDNNNSTTTNCAVKNKAGWWFKNCYYGCLTCKQGSNLTLWKNLPSTASLTGVRMRVMRK